MANCQYHLRNPRHPDGRGIAKRVRRQTIYGLYAAPAYLPSPVYGRKDHIIWECEHDGQIWHSNAEYAEGFPFPTAVFCSPGFDTLTVALIILLSADMVFQVRSCTDRGLNSD